jgi:hypothetical protein
MNDFSELESELRKLRPAPPSPELFSRVERALVDVAEKNKSADNVVRPDRFRVNWVSLGLGLAAAAVLLIVARLSFGCIGISAKQTRSATAEETRADSAVSIGRRTRHETQ